MNCIEYKLLSRSRKESIALYVHKKLVKKMYYDLAPMSVWTNRIKNLIIEKEDKIKITKDGAELNIDWDMNRISTWRSLFDIMYKDLKLILRTTTGDMHTKYEYHLKFTKQE